MNTPADGPRGLIVMSYGTPAGPEDVEPYYTHIRRGRPPSPALLAELQGRYEAIGGTSPLARRTHEQAEAMRTYLDALEPGRWHIALGNKHAPPFIEDAVDELTGRGVGSITGLVLAPHWSQASVGTYHQRALAAADGRGVLYHPIESWHDEPVWLDFMADRVRAALAHLPTATKVLFTAHSLPERLLEHDPYADHLWSSASAIARRAGLDPWYGWSMAWQSAGRTPEPWRGPDVADAIRELAATGRADGVLVCPQGFVSDHLEILYDLDIDAARVAAAAGLVFSRTPSLNDDAGVMTALAERARQADRTTPAESP